MAATLKRSVSSCWSLETSEQSGVDDDGEILLNEGVRICPAHVTGSEGNMETRVASIMAFGPHREPGARLRPCG